MSERPDPYLAAEPPGPPAPVARVIGTVRQTLPDGSERAWLGDHLHAVPRFHDELAQWMAWLTAHGINPPDVLSCTWVTRDPVARTVSAIVFGPPEQPGEHVLDMKAGFMVKHRHVVQLEAEPLPFPEPTP